MSATAPAESYSRTNVPESVVLPHTCSVAALVEMVPILTTPPDISSMRKVSLVADAVVIATDKAR